MMTDFPETESNADGGEWEADVFTPDEGQESREVRKSLNPADIDEIMSRLRVDLDVFIGEVDGMRAEGNPLISSIGRVLNAYLVRAEVSSALDRAHYVQIGASLRRALQQAETRYISAVADSTPENCETGVFIREYLNMKLPETVQLFRARVRNALYERAFNLANDGAKIDALTGLQNRGALDEALRKIEADSAANEVAVIFIDLDNFKLVNDRLSHEAGDEALKMISGVISSVVRDKDMCFRYGGDEFVLVMLNTGIDVARERAEVIRAAVEALSISCGYLDEKTVTASLGLTQGVGAAVQDLVKRADRGTNEAKGQGKNMVVVIS